MGLPRIKTMTAVAGAAAVIGLGVLSAVFGTSEAAAKVQFGGAGDTVTQTTPPPSLNIHGPLIKAVPYLGSS